MNFKRQAIVDFFNDWYRPDLQAIVVVGDLQNYEYGGLKGPKAMEQRVRDVFSQHPKAVNPKPRPVFTLEGNAEPLVAIATDKEATAASMKLIWKHPKAHVGTVADFRQSLIASLVTGMVNERLSDLAEKPSAPFMGASARRNGYIAQYVRQADDFTLNCAPKENRIDEAAALLLSEMRRLDQHGFLLSELERQKESLLAFYTRSAKEADKTHSNSLAGEITRHFLEGEVIPGIRQEWRYAKEFIPQISLDECNSTIASWITDDNFVFYLTAPQRDDYRVPSSSDVRRIIADSRQAATQPWVDTFQDSPLFTDVVPAVTPRLVKDNTAIGYQEYACPNGVRFVVMKTDHQADQIVFGSQAFGGSSLYPDNDYFLAANTGDLIGASGVADLSANQLSKKLKGKSLSVSPYIDETTQGFGGFSAPADLETALQLVNLYYSAPRTDTDLFSRTVEQLRSQIKLVADNPQVAFAQTYYRSIYPNDKRMVVIPSEEQISSLIPDSAFRIYRDRFHDASGQVFFFVGNLSDADIALIARYLNHLPADGSQRNEHFVNRSATFAKGVVHAEAVKGIEKQGILQLYGELNVDPKLLASPQTLIAFQALSNALEITLLEEVREKNGDAYSPAVSLWCDRTPTAQVCWKFAIGCDPDKIAKIEKDCIAILRQYQKQGPDEQTLAKVKEQMIVNHGTSVQNNYYWLTSLMDSYALSEDLDYLAHYDDLVRSLSAKQLQQLAKKYINLKNYVAVSLRPENPDAGQAD